ncbi:tetratricopeptide repeat protein [Planctomycetales bacterium ZRK34]|nr:tetratricopeptide repeat protein [Planctomycetales bacterium ZRK34]
MNGHLRTAVALMLMIAMIAGCKSTPQASNYETVPDMPARNAALAHQHNAEALTHLKEGEYEKAEKLLKQALEADVTFGPGHNNLGKTYYLQKKYYLAAWEFQYAIKLMPHQPEPRNNLGLVMEAVGKLDEAVMQYAQAAEIEPDNPQILGNLARAHVRRGDRGEDTQALLSELIMRDTRPQWVAWAREKLAMMQAKAPEQP